MKHYTATICNYGFEKSDVTFTDTTFKSLWNTVIKTIKDYAHDDAAFDGWRVRFEADGTVLDINMMVRCDHDTGWTDIFYRNKDRYDYLTSTLAQC